MVNEASSNEPLGEAMGCEVSAVQESSSSGYSQPALNSPYSSLIGHHNCQSPNWFCHMCK